MIIVTVLLLLVVSTNLRRIVKRECRFKPQSIGNNALRATYFYYDTGLRKCIMGTFTSYVVGENLHQSLLACQRRCMGFPKEKDYFKSNISERQNMSTMYLYNWGIPVDPSSHSDESH